MDTGSFDWNSLVLMVIGAAVPVVGWAMTKVVGLIRTAVANSSNKIDDQVLAAVEQALKNALDSKAPPAQ